MPLHTKEGALQFLDYYLKASQNGWNMTPRVRVAITDTGGSNRRAKLNEWPIEQTEHVKVYLDADRHTLSRNGSSCQAKTTYRGSTGKTTFVTTFAEDTQLLGYFSGHIFMEADGADDMDLFLTLEKLDRDGNLLTPLLACTVDLESQCISAAGSTRGTQACLRVSLRVVGRQESTSFFPVQTYGSPQKLAAGQMVPIDGAFIPSAYYFHAGQKLRLVISGQSDSGVSAINMDPT
ncbi:galactose-binding like protein [Aspergillus homomorphus CBS 101889]|uniref:Galactose-binding like protein n=1 Tax=Aspergillus homomorphus (strain CBS 101889) TaxID=1450537 RepID=A0A395HVR3_ASPHC|nr:galactose-binding like protein [Aspergillus homomorphus CBS 101889]RAL11485.1 galactose-binding like protein [Aspergillus homomorphus CBS 101889]